MIDIHFSTGFVFGCHLCPNSSDLGIKDFEKTKDFSHLVTNPAKSMTSLVFPFTCLVVKDSHCFTDEKLELEFIKKKLKRHLNSLTCAAME